MQELTDRQKEILGYIREVTCRNRYGASVRDIMRAFDFRSPNGAMCHLKALKKKGLIDWQPGTARSIVVLNQEPTLTLNEAFGAVNSAIAKAGFDGSVYWPIAAELEAVAQRRS